MIKVVTEDISVYFPIAQIKTMFYDRKKRIVKIIHVDNCESECGNVLIVSYNGEEI